MTKTIDVLGIGNAIMDVIAPINEEFLDRYNIERNAMTLIDEARALELTGAFQSHSTPQEIAGGSAANTIAGVAEIGLKTGYLGKIASDALGLRFKTAMNESGVIFNGISSQGSPATARSMIAVTPNGDRSMNTFLGISTEFGRDDLDEALIQSSKLVYMEGYLFDKEPAKAAYVRASELAKAAGSKVSLTLSDSFCVDRHRDSFRGLVENHIDILFANEDELLSLYERTDFDAALSDAAKFGTAACITRGEKGSIILDGHQRFDIAADPVKAVIDTTGAGDQYAAGVLSGHSLGLGWEQCGQLGSLCAAEVISHYGARPVVSIKDLAQAKGFKL